ncbi:sensor histidine kinase [Seonamhaeicola aphaedonensis]|uniref:Histidine kinase n=1 Tax=Seonamhaeicola aphaedonensis TaxID=1461338 RepID=A0A3D9HM55_9FLAO|nr:sensor histidine kinase [Seonamhaeicola aphaedonensis]RED49986.1 histidine kinase [Seonamhaeicola aphaedonensis]
MNNFATRAASMSLRDNILFNLVLWACLFVVFLFVFAESLHPYPIDVIYTVGFLLTALAPVLINFFILIPKLLKSEKYLLYLITFVINLLVFSKLSTLYFERSLDYLFPDYYFISYHSNTTLFTIYSLLLGGTTLIKLSVDWFYFNRQENRELKMKNKQIQTQLSLLRSQINPHFLFNSLNVIYALAIEKKIETKDAIVQLSDILRYVIYDSNTPRVALKDEITLLKNYIEFQKFRQKETGNIKFNCKVDNENYQIYPMLLIPLVENSFKYGIKGDINNNFLNIDLSLQNDEFMFHIENNYSPDQLKPNQHSGVGLENIKKNLEIIYAKTHEFKIVKTKDTFGVILKLHKHEMSYHKS